MQDGRRMEASTFFQQQVGHAYQSTTTIYTAVSGDFANRMMRNAISGLLEGAGAGKVVE